MKSHRLADEMKLRNQIETLKNRRVALWKFAHSLPEGDEKRIEAEEAARKIYDGLKDLGVL